MFCFLLYFNSEEFGFEMFILYQMKDDINYIFILHPSKHEEGINYWCREVRTFFRSWGIEDDLVALLIFEKQYLLE